MLKKTSFWLCLLLVSVIAMPGWALPNSMIMIMEINSKQGTRPVKANAKLWYANQKFRAEVSSNLNTSQANTPVRIGNKATIVMDLKSKIGYMIDDSSKMAIKIDEKQVGNMTGNSAQGNRSFTDPAMLTDPAKVKAEIIRQGGKQIGKEKLLGHNCTIWQMSGKMPAAQGQPAQTATSKVWLADALGMPLKVQVSTDKQGEIVSMRVTNVQVNVPVNNNLFGVPAGYQVRNIADMYKAPR
ncbi:MAG: hypothetical protein CVV27_04650 [Candidatus Melainabacteria bacterium HGW-Melainabacteria-1]|nr:MAG: hypothetical protein CVV27_04650 [Candidatus Melainabacteria bacterium HGW-Melainabacteria-1]